LIHKKRDPLERSFMERLRQDLDRSRSGRRIVDLSTRCHDPEWSAPGK
jgi:hypothetical protein